MAKYRSPFTAAATITTPFKKSGNWRAGYHTGEDWVCSDRTLVSPANGVISYIGYDNSGYGNYLIIHTSDKKCILMAHFVDAPQVSVGDTVNMGQKIATMGSTGNSTGVHLHIEVENSTEWNYAKNLLRPSEYIDFTYFSDKGDNTMQKGDNNYGVLCYKLLLIQLQQKGIIKQGVDGNGIFGDGTVTATKQLQTAAGLKVTGIADSNTLKAAAKLLANTK